MNKVIIQTQLKLEDFIAVNFAMYFKRTSVKIRFFILALFILAPWLLPVFDIPYNDPYPALIGIGIMALLMLGLYLGARRNFLTNKRLSEPMTYDFNDDRLLLTSESSNVSTSWDKVYKVTETKGALVIWLSAQLVNCIPKRDTNGADLAIIKSILQQNKVKNNLK